MSASKACPVCGALNDPTNAYCISCGRPLFATPTASPPPTPYPSAIPPGAVPPIAAYPYLPSPPPRQATVGTILSGMFDVWTKNLKEFFVVFFVLALVNGLLGALVALAIFGTFGPSTGLFPGGPPVGIPPSALANLVLFAIISVVAGAIVNSIVSGGMTEFAVRRFRGESITLERALRRGLDRFLSILGASLLLTLLLLALVFVPFLLILLPFTGGTTNPPVAFGAICGGFAVLVIGGLIALYVIVATGLYAPAIMMENANATEGLMRSWRLTKRHWWSLFGALLVAGILGGVITLAVTAPIGFLRSPFANILATALANGLVGAWSVILASVAYDLLVRQPSYGPPPYYPGVTLPPPAGAVQTPQPPTAPPPPPAP
ncbi:MAG: hypothetical protein E6K05_00740 [Methanobacteriota archaeon]|nr:MAG: hypothetical protein E6K05_00740 [Euryarchaeota archaeon]